MKTQINNANDLKNLVSKWVDTFNFVQLEVLEKIAGDNGLFEYIRQDKPDYNDFISNYQLDKEYKDYLKENGLKKSKDLLVEFCEQHHKFDDWRSEQEQNNYPMWNTCFEFKESISDEIREAAQKAGFGIIEGLDPFNTILFVSGAGYSFYGAHWIPLFLELPWNSDIKAEVKRKKIDYSNQ